MNGKEFIKAVKLITEEKGISEYPFSDVTAKDPYAKSVAFLKSANLMSGYPDGTFRPDNYTISVIFFSTELLLFSGLHLPHPYKGRLQLP